MSEKKRLEFCKEIVKLSRTYRKYIDEEDIIYLLIRAGCFNAYLHFSEDPDQIITNSIELCRDEYQKNLKELMEQI